MPFKTPQQIQDGMQTKTRKICHDRILQTIIKLLKRPLISANFSVGGCQWTYQQVEVWLDYITGKIEKSDLSPGFCRETGRRGDPRKMWRVVDEETSPRPGGKGESSK